MKPLSYFQKVNRCSVIGAIALMLLPAIPASAMDDVNVTTPPAICSSTGELQQDLDSLFCVFQNEAPLNSGHLDPILIELDQQGTLSFTTHDGRITHTIESLDEDLYLSTSEVPALLYTLKNDPNAFNRKCAINLLSECYDSNIEGKLIDALEIDKNEQVRIRIICIFNSRSECSRDVHEALIRAAQVDDSSNVRRQAMSLVLQLMPSGVWSVGQLETLLETSPDPSVRSRAALALGGCECSDTTSLSALLRAVIDVTPEVRVAGIAGLSLYYGAHPRTTVILLNLLKHDPNSFVRFQSASALGRIDSPAQHRLQAVHALDVAVKTDPSVIVSNQAKRSLKELNRR